MSNSSVSLIEKCFPEHQLVLMSDLERRINHFVFPIQFLVTVLGNLLTMSVLVSRHMKNRANHLLAFLALSDILVFIMMVPHYMASLDVLTQSTDFIRLHFHTKVHFAALSNWFSAAAIWFVLAISVERLLIIKYPFRSLDEYNVRQVILVATLIFVATFLLTSYHHISHTCFSWVVCSGSQAIGLCFPNTLPSFGKRPNPTSDATKSWIAFSVYMNAFLAVLGPIFAVALINVSLIRLLKRRHCKNLRVQGGVSTTQAQLDQERRMTHTVLAIVTCFTLTQGPSAVVFCLQHIHPATPHLREISIFANQLVLTGKMLNIVLFCLTSQTFRRKMLFTCHNWLLCLLFCSKKSYTSRFSREQSKKKYILQDATAVVRDAADPSFRTQFP